MRGVVGGIVAAALAVSVAIALGAPAVSPATDGACAPPTGDRVCAGVAAVDASWHVGASAGQYASDGTFIDPENETFDPSGHSVRRSSSYGIQSRLSARALVVQDPDSGDRFALVKNDFYIPQDLVYRRAAQIVAEERPDLGIGPANMTMAVTHNHNSPFYASTSWGVWTFQDVFDIRFYSYMARKMADAVEQAADDMRPVRVGASVVNFDKTHRHSYGPQLADDGTPAGYPKSDSVHDVTLVRLDDVSDPGDPKPYANLLNWGQHPESLNGNDLISADYLGPLQRMLDRETGATTVFTQGAVGTAEPERDEWHSIHDRAQFSHREYAQAEYGARLIANAAERAFDDVGDGGGRIPFSTNFPVQFADHWYPGPIAHPYPTVSNCRSDYGLESGDPKLPVIGLPDCNTLQEGLGNLSDLIGEPEPPQLPHPIEPGLNTDDFERAGIPITENYGAPGYTGLHEDIDVHLQAFRLGDILFTVCPCEEFKDQWENIVTRTDTTPDNEYRGYDWSAQCTPNGPNTPRNDDGDPESFPNTSTWTCPDPRNGSTLTVSNHAYQKMHAQVNNPANGWNDLDPPDFNAVRSESEPADPTQIKGNFTEDDSEQNAGLGYALTVPMAMGNDYNGYIPSYREYQQGDHYRKALAGWGPHSSDYMATRLVTLGRIFKDSDDGNMDYAAPGDQQLEDTVYLPKTTADQQLNNARAEALGHGGDAAIAAYEATLPDDGGQARPVQQPADVERFGAALFTWIGGSNFTDNPEVKVQRQNETGQWEDYADQSGEIPVTVEFPHGEDVASYEMGGQEWHWTADFEAFVAGFRDRTFNTGDRDAVTPAGTYRFVVHGQRRQGHAVTGYDVESDAFEVTPWDGIRVEAFRLEPDDTMSFTLGPTTTRTASGGGLNGVGGPDLSAEIGPIDYPDQPDIYDGPDRDPRVARFIKQHQLSFERDPQATADPSRLEWYCFTCTFRPWVDYGDAQSAKVAITLGNGSTEVVDATKQGDRWVTSRQLRRNETARVLVGGVRDPYGNFNGEQSNKIDSGTAPPDADGDDTGDDADNCLSVAGPPSNQGCPIEPQPGGGAPQGGSQQGGAPQQGQPAAPGPDPRCASLRAKLTKLKQSGAKPAARRKLRGRLRSLGC